MKTPEEILSYILHHRPTGNETDEEIQDPLGSYLSDDFDHVDLTNHIDIDSLILTKPLIAGNIAKILVMAPNYFLAILIRGNDHQWRLRNFTFQCSACFGDGIEGSGICGACGGSGWGTLGDIEFCKGSN